MGPDNVLNSRSLTLVAFFCAVVFTAFFPRTGETSPLIQAQKTLGYCMAESGGVGYFSPIYDLKLNNPARMSTDIIAREFVEYLKGRYGYVQ